MVVFFSSTKREGRWTLPRALRVAAVMGSAELDLREAAFAEGVSEIEVMAVLGNVEIFVPVGVRVECSGEALAGNFEVRMSGAPDVAPGAPVLRIRGSAYFANVEVVVKGVDKKMLRAEEKLRLKGS